MSDEAVANARGVAIPCARMVAPGSGGDHASIPMTDRKCRLALAITLLMLWACWSQPALAYVDPNAGGMLFQILYPALTATVVFAVFLRDRVVKLFQGVLRLLAPSRAVDKK